MNSVEPGPSRRRILLTGASGYVGGRLLTRLERRGERVRCLARRPEALQSRVGESTEIVQGDVLDRASLEAAMQDVDTAYYLVHSMGSRGSFEVADRDGARNFGTAARTAGVRRIVYLGGLGREDEDLSPHLRSRQEVGRLLGEGGVPVLELRASIVIGSGSLSLEMIRSLVERLPVMITPKWVHVPAQPIAIDDLLDYLLESLDLPDDAVGVYEIGGADQVSYADIMRAYARHRGLPLRMIPVPVLTPRLSSLWLGLVTPLYARVGRKLIESMVHPTIVHDPAALRAFGVRPVGVDEALRRVVAQTERELDATRWTDAVSSAGPVRSWEGVHLGTRMSDVREIHVDVPATAAFAPIERIGGTTGWYAYDWLWHLRGALDLLVGGVGMRRGRPSPDRLRVGDTLDFWRVEAFEPDRLLRLQAEMRVPGRAWLQFDVIESGDGSTIRQSALFDPAGWHGKMYWYALIPVHQLVFGGMLRAIARAARRGASPH